MPSAGTISTLCQVTVAFLIAGFGNVGAGLILDYVKEWPVFLHVDELFIMVPSLLGLKGNLEMTMAARLSTQANLGHMDNPHELLKMAKGNLALLQCQATVVSFMVALFASFIKSLTISYDSQSEQVMMAPEFTTTTTTGMPTNAALAATSISSNLLVNNNNNLIINNYNNKNYSDSIHNYNYNQSATNASQQLLLAASGLGQQQGTSSTLTSLLLGAAAAASSTSFTSTPSPLMVAANSNEQLNFNSDLLANDQALAAGSYGGGGVILEQQAQGFNWDNTLILCASCLLTANIASFVLGTMMILVIVASYKVRIDPDNVASPVAASFGDMTTAALLAVIAHSIYHYSQSHRSPFLALVTMLIFLGMLPIWISVARANPYTSNVLTKGWTPIVIAVIISACGGFILEYGKSRFNRLPVFQPVINGVGGNLVAVQASRLSTSLHKTGKPGQIPSNFKLSTGPFEIFLARRSDVNLITARLLLLISIPAHLLYFFVIRSIETDASTAAQPVSGLFLGLYMLMAITQVAILLYLAQNLVTILWRCSIDPDNFSTPLLTATGDLLGCAFLLLVFVIAYQFNDPFASTIV